MKRQWRDSKTDSSTENPSAWQAVAECGLQREQDQFAAPTEQNYQTQADQPVQYQQAASPKIAGSQEEQSVLVSPASLDRPLPAQRTTGRFNKRRIETGCIVVAELGCLLLLGGLFFLPKGIGHSEFLQQLKVGASLTSLPAMLQMAEFVGGAAGLLLIPMMAGPRRGRLLLNLGFGLMALLVLALLSHNPMGFNLVFVPMLSLLSLVLFDTAMRIAPAMPGEPSLARWRLATSCAVAGIWFLPAVIAVHSSGSMLGIRMSHGPLLHHLLVAGCVSGELAGLTGLLACAIGNSKYIIQAARMLGIVAMMFSALVGLVATLTVSGVLRDDMHWFGVELVWIALLVFGCMMLVWSGMMQKFAIKVDDVIHEQTPQAA